MQLQDFIDVEAFTKEITEEITDLTEAMRTQTARAAFYSINATKAKKQKEEVALNVKVIEAALTKKMREKLTKAAIELAEEEGTRVEKVTVDMVKAEVTLHPEMRKWMKIQIEADEIYAVCKAAYDAFYTRREMLTSMGHMSRAEMQSNLRTMARAGERAAGDSRSRYQERLRARGSDDGESAQAN